MAALLLRTDLDGRQRHLAEVIRESGAALLEEIEALLGQATDSASPTVGLRATPIEPGRALVVDDHPVNREIAKAMLRDLGWDCTEAVDGPEAVAMASTESFDLVLIDRRLPGLDGLSAVRAIREAEGATATARILGWTAQPDEKEVAAFRAAGADHCLGKPLTPEALASALGLDPAAGWFVDPGALRALAEFSGGDPEFVPRMVGAFFDDTQARHAAISRAVADGDAEALESVAHALRGASRHLGAHALADLAASIEEGVEGGRFPAAETLTRLDEVVRETFGALERLLDPE